MQDVSLENMLLYIAGNGDESVAVCDPGQACPFAVDPATGEEIPSEFRGFVAKEFRAPELYDKKEFLATKVDSWCLGWSAFYLLCAQPLFHSADLSENDPDWVMFQTKPSKAFAFKGWRPELSAQAQDFIVRLLHVDPEQRMSVRDALRHPWLAEVGRSGQPDTATLRAQVRPCSVTDDDSQSMRSSAGSHAPSAAPTPKSAKWTEPKVQGARLSAPTLLQHASQHFKGPSLPIASRDGKAQPGVRKPPNGSVGAERPH